MELGTDEVSVGKKPTSTLWNPCMARTDLKVANEFPFDIFLAHLYSYCYY